MSARTPKPLFPWRKPPSPPPDPTPFQNTEKLVDAVNGAASTVAALHVAFMALSAYLAVTVWGATHVDFLKESPVKLPLIDVQVDLTSFYGVAPWLYVLVHLNLLIRTREPPPLIVSAPESCGGSLVTRPRVAPRRRPVPGPTARTYTRTARCPAGTFPPPAPPVRRCNNSGNPSCGPSPGACAAAAEL